MPALFWTIFGILMGLLALCATIVIVVFLIVFYVPNRTQKWLEKYTTPPGKVYDQYRPQMIECMKQIRAMEHTQFELTSFDGLTLRGKYYEIKKGAPIELMLHGYRGCAESDLSVGVLRAHKLGHNAFLVDHRAAGFSDGTLLVLVLTRKKIALIGLTLLLKLLAKTKK